MPKLGEAYVRVRADLEPFGKDLDRGLKVITDKFEKALNRNFGRAIGKEVGTGAREGISESSKGIGAELDKALNVPANRQRGRRAGRAVSEGIGDGMKQVGPIKRALASFISALEDGFSALPVEAKAVVGAAVLAAIIPSGALLASGAALATIGVVTAIGVALASQFEEVESRFTTFVDDLRMRGVRAAEPFVDEIIGALDMFDDRLDALDPQIRNLFLNASKYVDPFAKGFADAVSNVITGLNTGLENAEFSQLAYEIQTGLGAIGESLGQTFATILANPDLDVALGDLLDMIEDLVYWGGQFLSFSISVYRSFKDIITTTVRLVETMGDLFDIVVALTTAPGGDWVENLDRAWTDFLGTEEGVVRVGHQISEVQAEQRQSATKTIKLTEEQEKALEALNKQLVEELKLTNDVISANVDYQESIDETIAGFKEYGTSLDFGKEKGRENIENIQEQINKLKEFTRTQIEDGKMTEEQAQKYYDNEIARLREEFRKRGGNLKQFDDIFTALIKLNGAPPVPDKFGGWTSTLSAIGRALADIIAKQKKIAAAPAPKPPYVAGSGGQQAYADGGFVTQPTNAILGENYKEEVVLPLTQPQRSMQLLSQSPLAGMMGGGGTNVAVYIGNEQLDAKVYRVAVGVNRQAARTLSQTPRLV